VKQIEIQALASNEECEPFVTVSASSSGGQAHLSANVFANDSELQSKPDLEGRPKLILGFDGTPMKEYAQEASSSNTAAAPNLIPPAKKHKFDSSDTSEESSASSALRQTALSPQELALYSAKLTLILKGHKATSIRDTIPAWAKAGLERPSVTCSPIKWDAHEKYYGEMQAASFSENYAALKLERGLPNTQAEHERLFTRAAYLTMYGEEGGRIFGDIVFHISSSFTEQTVRVKDGVDALINYWKSHNAFAALDDGYLGHAACSNIWNEFWDKFEEPPYGKACHMYGNLFQAEFNDVVSHLRSFVLGLEIRRDAHASFPQMEKEILQSTKDVICGLLFDDSTIQLDRRIAQREYDSIVERIGEADLEPLSLEQRYRVRSLKDTLTALNGALKSIEDSKCFFDEHELDLIHRNLSETIMGLDWFSLKEADSRLCNYFLDMGEHASHFRVTACMNGMTLMKWEKHIIKKEGIVTAM
jgi:hypothetical protein